MPPSKQSRKLGGIQEWHDSSNANSPILVACILLTLLVCHQLLSHHHVPQVPEIHVSSLHLYLDIYHHSFIHQHLLVSGDVESNPGPAFSTEQLDQLKSGAELHDKPTTTLNIHIIQLLHLKKKDTSVTWAVEEMAGIPDGHRPLPTSL